MYQEMMKDENDVIAAKGTYAYFGYPSYRIFLRGYGGPKMI